MKLRTRMLQSLFSVVLWLMVGNHSQAINEVAVGIDIPGVDVTNSCITVTNGQVVTFGHRFSSPSVALAGLQPVVSIGNTGDFNATNVLQITHASLLAGPDFLVTNSLSYFWNHVTGTGLQLHPWSNVDSQPNAGARAMWVDVFLEDTGQRLTNTGFACLWTGTIHYQATTNYIIPLKVTRANVLGINGFTYTLSGQGVTNSINRNFYLRVLGTPQPQIANVAHDAGNSTMGLTVNLDPGTSNVVLYCTELGGPETAVTNIVIPLDAPDKVTTNITVAAPGQKGFWRIQSIRPGSGAASSALPKNAVTTPTSSHSPKRDRQTF